MSREAKDAVLGITWAIAFATFTIMVGLQPTWLWDLAWRLYMWPWKFLSNMVM